MYSEPRWSNKCCNAVPHDFEDLAWTHILGVVPGRQWRYCMRGFPGWSNGQHIPGTIRQGIGYGSSQQKHSSYEQHTLERMIVCISPFTTHPFSCLYATTALHPAGSKYKWHVECTDLGPTFDWGWWCASSFLAQKDRRFGIGSA